jgi:hypothetical protein
MIQKRKPLCKYCLQPRRGHPKTCPAKVKSTTGATQNQWQFEDGQTWDGTKYTETNDWKSFSSSLSDRLVAASSNKVRILTLNVHGNDYVIDLFQMVQVRQTFSPQSGMTGYMRRIRPNVGQEQTIPQTALHQPSSSSASTSASTSTSTSASTSASTSSKITLLNNVSTAMIYRDMDILDFSGSLDNFPTYWQQTSGEILLDNSGKLYKQVANMVLASLFTGSYKITSSTYDLHSIGLVCNRSRFNMYQVKKNEMTRRLKNVNEMWLWHGLGGTNVESILKNGFIRDLGKRQAFGDGTYFATHSSYSWSDQFMVPDLTTKEKVIMLVRVLVGESCLGKSGKTMPDVKKDGFFYDSMVDNLTKPHMYILSAGSDFQSYPEFVIRFR